MERVARGQERVCRVGFNGSTCYMGDAGTLAIRAPLNGFASLVCLLTLLRPEGGAIEDVCIAHPTCLGSACLHAEERVLQVLDPSRRSP